MLFLVQLYWLPVRLVWQFGSVAPAGIACGVSHSQQLRQLLQTWQVPEMRRWVVVVMVVVLLLMVMVWCC
jgi:hypothetical protein